MDHTNDLKIEDTKSLSIGIRGPNTNYDSINVLNVKTKNFNLETMYGIENPAFEEEEKPSENGNVMSLGLPSLIEGHYDPHDFGNCNNPTSFWGTVGHIVIISAGPAILSIPSASVHVGYVTLIILIPLIVFLYVHNMYMIVWSEYEISKLMREPKLPYSEVVYQAFQYGPSAIRWFAPCGKILSYIVFITIWFFFCCYNYIIICQNLNVFFSNMFTLDLSVKLLVILLFPVFLLLSYVPKLSYLVPISFIGNVSNYIAFVLVIYYIIKDPTPWNIPQQFGPFASIPLCVGTIIFTLNATGIMIPLKHDMKKPKKFNSKFGVLFMSYTPVALLYAFLSLISFLKYGTNVKDSVIENLPADAPLAQAGILLSSLTLITQYPLFIYVNVDVIYNDILKEKKKSVKYKLFWEYVLRTVLVVVSFVISFISPNIFLFLSLSGTIGTSIDSFILPAFMQTLVTWKICENRWRLSWIVTKNTLIILLALIVVAGGITDCWHQISGSK